MFRHCLLALVIGGVSSLWGAAIGAVLLTFMPEWFHQLQNAYGLVLGGLVIVLLTVEPRGSARLPVLKSSRTFGSWEYALTVAAATRTKRVAIDWIRINHSSSVF